MNWGVNMKIKVLLTILMLSVASTAQADSDASPIGLWKAYDDEQKPTGYVRIIERDGFYTGIIEKGLETDKEDKYCTECKDERKGQKLVGMTIIKGVKANGNTFEGTEILDPFSGKTYRVKLTLKEQNKMEVRGFIGVSLFGRTQVWERSDNGK